MQPADFLDRLQATAVGQKILAEEKRSASERRRKLVQQLADTRAQAEAEMARLVAVKREAESLYKKSDEAARAAELELRKADQAARGMSNHFRNLIGRLEGELIGSAPSTIDALAREIAAAEAALLRHGVATHTERRWSGALVTTTNAGEIEADLERVRAAREPLDALKLLPADQVDAALPAIREAAGLPPAEDAEAVA